MTILRYINSGEERSESVKTAISKKMFSLCLLGLLAAASAAPQYFQERPHHHHHHGPHLHQGYGALSDEVFGEDLFDTKRFWEGLSLEMHKFDQILTDFSRHFPSMVANQGIVGDEYQITITLTGFEEKDIVVKAREGVLMVQAVHKSEDGNQKSFMDLRTLPAYVNVTGNWAYKNDVLKISFPLKYKPTETPVPATEEPILHSREEMDPTVETDVQNADVGLERGDNDDAVRTNVIPRQNVEATTYAVDLKDEVEFVPVKYK